MTILSGWVISQIVYGVFTIGTMTYGKAKRGQKIETVRKISFSSKNG